MDWGLISVILAIIFGIATVVSIIIAVRLARRKKPAWAYQTKMVVGLGSNAPPELKLIFKDTEVSEVYRTKFIFFNRGTESIIYTNDVIKPITIRFGNAQILREPIIRPSNDDIVFTAKHVNDCIEVGFKYLDYKDGAVVEVLHTVSDKPDCQGKIIGVEKISYLGDFEETILNTSGKVSIGIAIFCVVIFILLEIPNSFIKAWLPKDMSLLIFAAIGMFVGASITPITKFFRLRKFPLWSHQHGS